MTSDDGDVPVDARRLRMFEGAWTIEGSMTAAGTVSHITGRWAFVRAVDGWGVRGDMVTEIEGLGSFEEAEFIGFDSSNGVVHMFSINKFAIRDHVGRFDGETLITRYDGPGDGREISEEIAIAFESPGRMTARIVELADGEPAITTDLTLTRIE